MFLFHATQRKGRAARFQSHLRSTHDRAKTNQLSRNPVTQDPRSRTSTPVVPSPRTVTNEHQSTSADRTIATPRGSESIAGRIKPSHPRMFTPGTVPRRTIAFADRPALIDSIETVPPAISSDANTDQNTTNHARIATGCSPKIAIPSIAGRVFVQKSSAHASQGQRLVRKPQPSYDARLIPLDYQAKVYGRWWSS